MIAIIPLIVFISGFVASFVIPPLSGFIGHNFTYIFGTLFVVGSCFWAYFIADPILPDVAPDVNSFDVIGVGVVSKTNHLDYKRVHCLLKLGY